ncbi:MAG TPA: iron ABC transporter substrate-binding protein, partial [Lactococcus sp.]|nr:iron ABC transporter substrate-binding protein [Lactococcus sp.]
YYIDNGRSSLPNQHIVGAMKEMAKVVYPDVFKNLE